MWREPDAIGLLIQWTMCEAMCEVSVCSLSHKPPGPNFLALLYSELCAYDYHSLLRASAKFLH